MQTSNCWVFVTKTFYWKKYMPYTTILEQLHIISWNIYFGGILLFSIYSLFNTKKSQAISVQFQGFGVIFGLSLGISILSKIIFHWLQIGHYYPGTTLEKIGFSLAFLIWLSNMILEIWTLDPNILVFDSNI